MGGIYSGITAMNHFEDYGLSNEAMKNFVENFLIKSATEACESATGRCLEEIKTTKETKSGIVAKGSSQLPIRAHFTKIDKKLRLEQGDRVIAICSMM